MMRERFIWTVGLLCLKAMCAGPAWSQGFPDETTLQELDPESLPEGFAEGAWEDLSVLEDVGQAGDQTASLNAACGRLPGGMPMDLNAADRERLEGMGLWSPAQVAALLVHRQRYGALDRLEELQSLPAFELEQLRRQARCFRVAGTGRAREPWYRTAFGGKHQWLWRMELGLERPAAYRDSIPAYGGDRSRQVFQYRYRHDRLQYGLAFEKDAGESWWNAARSPGAPGPDFASAHLHWRQHRRPNRRFQVLDALAGDYALRFGQGLVHWSGFGVGKGNQAVALVRSASPFQRYGGLDENRFLRGAALRAAKGSWHGSLFAARKRVDANGSDSSGYSSLRTDGYHRNPSEFSSRDALGELLYGALLQYEGLHGQLGLLYSHQRYSAPILPTERLDNGAAFRGQHIRHAALHGRWLLGNAQAFGEAALLNGRAEALLLGWQTSLHPSLDATLLWRHYDTAYHAPYSMAFAEGSTPRNETGVYLGLRWSPNHRWVLDAYLDRYRAPWLRYLVDAPSQGWETRAVLRYKPKRHAELHLRLRWERKQETESVGPLDLQAPLSGSAAASGWPLEEGLRWSDRVGVRFHLTWPMDPDWRWQCRAEGVGAREAALLQATGPRPHRPFRWGWLLFQDLRYAPLGSPFRLHVRAMLFQTADYDTRVYAYENDVLGAFSIPFFQGRGQRAYLLVRYRLSRSIDLYARLSSTHYAGQSAVGEGPDQTEGPSRHQLKTLLRLRW